jgi:hypothetical protein
LARAVWCWGGHCPATARSRPPPAPAEQWPRPVPQRGQQHAPNLVQREGVRAGVGFPVQGRDGEADVAAADEGLVYHWRTAEGACHRDSVSPAPPNRPARSSRAGSTRPPQLSGPVTQEAAFPVRESAEDAVTRARRHRRPVRPREVVVRAAASRRGEIFDHDPELIQVVMHAGRVVAQLAPAMSVRCESRDA